RGHGNALLVAGRDSTLLGGADTLGCGSSRCGAAYPVRSSRRDCAGGGAATLLIWVDGCARVTEGDPTSAPKRCTSRAPHLRHRRTGRSRVPRLASGSGGG